MPDVPLALLSVKHDSANLVMPDPHATAVSAKLAGDQAFAAQAARADIDIVSGPQWAITNVSDDGHAQLQLSFSSGPIGDVHGRGTGHISVNNAEWDSVSEPVEANALGVSKERLRGAIGPIAFTVKREAGTFACSGSAGGGSGAGLYVYTRSAAFDEALASRGFARPTERQSVVLAMHDLTVAFVDEYMRPAHASTVDLVHVAEHGIGPEYVRALAAAGYHIATIDGLVRMRDHGVSPESIAEFKAAGYGNLSADDFVALADHGVRPHLLHALADAGYPHFSAADLVRLADHGVNDDFIAEFAKGGQTRPSADELVRLADHGVNPSYVSSLAKLGYTHLSAEEFIQLADHGVSASFVDRLQSHGYKNVPVSDLIRLRDSGL